MKGFPIIKYIYLLLATCCLLVANQAKKTKLACCPELGSAQPQLVLSYFFYMKHSFQKLLRQKYVSFPLILHPLCYSFAPMFPFNIGFEIDFPLSSLISLLMNLDCDQPLILYPFHPFYFCWALPSNILILSCISN